MTWIKNITQAALIIIIVGGLGSLAWLNRDAARDVDSETSRNETQIDRQAAETPLHKASLLSLMKRLNIKQHKPKDMASDFELVALDGSTVRLSQYRGKKVVLLNFWTTW